MEVSSMQDQAQDITGLMSCLNNMEKLVKTKDEQLQSSQQALKETETKLAQNIMEMSSLQREMFSTNTHLRESQRQLSDLKSQLAEEKEKLKISDVRYNELLGRLERTKKAFEERIEDADNHVRDAVKEQEFAAAHIAQLTTQLTEERDRLAANEKIRADLEKYAEESDNRLRDVVKGKQIADQQIAQLIPQLETERAKQLALETKINDVLKAKDDLDVEYKKLQQQLLVAEQDTEVIQQQLFKAEQLAIDIEENCGLEIAELKERAAERLGEVKEKAAQQLKESEARLHAMLADMEQMMNVKAETDTVLAQTTNRLNESNALLREMEALGLHTDRELIDMKEKLRDADAQVQRLSEELSSSQDENNKLKEQNVGSEDELRLTISRLITATSTIQSLERERDETNEKVNQFLLTFQEKDEKISVLLLQIEDLQVQMTGIQSNLDESRNSCDGKDKELEVSKRQLEGSEKAMAALRAEASTVLEKSETYVRNVEENLRTELDAMNENLRTATEQSALDKVALKECHEKINTLEESLEACVKNLQLSESFLEETKGLLVAAENRCNHLTKELSETKNLLVDAHASEQLAEQKAGMLKSQLKTAEDGLAGLAVLKEKSSVQIAERDRLKAECSELHNELSSTQERLLDTEGKVKFFQGLLKDADKRYNDLEVRLIGSDSQLKSTISAYENVEAMLKSAEVQILTLEAQLQVNENAAVELKNYKQHLKDAQSALDGAQATVDRLITMEELYVATEAELQKLRKDVEDLNRKLIRLESCEVQLVEKTARLQSADNELVSLRLRTSELELGRDSLLSKMNQMEARAVEAESRNHTNELRLQSMEELLNKSQERLKLTDKLLKEALEERSALTNSRAAARHEQLDKFNESEGRVVLLESSLREMEDRRKETEFQLRLKVERIEKLESDYRDVSAQLKKAEMMLLEHEEKAAAPEVEQLAARLNNSELLIDQITARYNDKELALKLCQERLSRYENVAGFQAASELDNSSVINKGQNDTNRQDIARITELESIIAKSNERLHLYEGRVHELENELETLKGLYDEACSKGQGADEGQVHKFEAELNNRTMYLTEVSELLSDALAREILLQQELEKFRSSSKAPSELNEKDSPYKSRDHDTLVRLLMEAEVSMDAYEEEIKSLRNKINVEQQVNAAATNVLKTQLYDLNQTLNAIEKDLTEKTKQLHATNSKINLLKSELENCVAENTQITFEKERLQESYDEMKQMLEVLRVNSLVTK